MKRTAMAILIGAASVAALSACSSTATGSGHADVPPASSAAAVVAAVTPIGSPSTVTAIATQTQPPASATHSTVTHSATPTPTSTPTAVQGPPSLGVITGVVDCSGDAGSGTVKLTWTSTGADAVYIEESPVASSLVSADPKADGRARRSPDSTATLPFSCADGTDNYLVEAYNDTAGTSSDVIESLQKS
jgi:hypothetical protein